MSTLSTLLPKKPVEFLDLNPLTAIRTIFQEYMHLNDRDLWAIDFMIVGFLSSKMGRDAEPLCGAIIGPAATGKTEVLRPFFTVPGLSEVLDETTDNGLCSGSPSITQSFINFIDRRYITVPDLTIFRTKGGDKWDTFFSFVRRTFDGEYNKVSGAREDKMKIICRYGMMLACTEILYNIMEYDSAMGQRFMCIRAFNEASREDRRKIAKKIATCQPEGWRVELANRVHAQVNRIKDFLHDPDYTVPRTRVKGEGSNEYRLRNKLFDEEAQLGWDHCKIELPTSDNNDPMFMFIDALQNTVAQIRSASLKEEKNTNDYEGPGRLTKQIMSLMGLHALAHSRRYLNDSDYEFARIICRDTVTPNRLDLVRALHARYKTGFLTVTELATSSRLADDKAAQLLAQWSKTGFIDYRPRGSLPTYRMTTETYEDLNLCLILTSANGTSSLKKGATSSTEPSDPPAIKELSPNDPTTSPATKNVSETTPSELP